MNDAYFRDKLSAYLDNQLPPDERLIVEQYLAAHPEAQKELEELRQFTAMVDQQAALRDDLYWEKSALKIEAALGFGKVKAPKEKEAGWQWTPFQVSAMVATAASLVLVAYIGLKDREHIEQRVEDKFNTTNDKSIQRQAVPSTADSGVPLVVDSTASMNAQKRVATQPPLPKSQTTDKRPQLATDKDVKDVKDSAVSSSVQESTADEAAGASQPFAVPAPPASQKMAEREEAKKELAEPPMALSAESSMGAAQEDLAQTKTDEIGKLLHQRDSLYALLKKEKSQVGKVNSLTQESKPSLFKTKPTVPNEQMSLLTVWYQLARQSSDSTLKQQSIDSLTKYSTGTDQQLRKQAQAYLDSLAVSKPDSGR